MENEVVFTVVIFAIVLVGTLCFVCGVLFGWRLAIKRIFLENRDLLASIEPPDE